MVRLEDKQRCIHFAQLVARVGTGNGVQRARFHLLDQVRAFVAVNDQPDLELEGLVGLRAGKRYFLCK